MLVRAMKIIAIGVIALGIVAISLPVASFAATSPIVLVLSPMFQGLRAPVKMVLDAGGNAYVADQRVGGIVKYDPYGAKQLTIRTATAPSGLVFAQDGTLLVSQSSFVARYDIATGQELGRLADGHLQSPTGIAADDAGYIYVSDSGAKQVVVFASDGSYIKEFGKGLLTMPTGIVFEKISRQLAVADVYAHKIQFFDTLGNIVKSIGNSVPGSATAIVAGTIGAMQFEAPVAVTFEYSKGTTPLLSRIYVVDAFQSRVQVVDPVAMSWLSNVGTPGTANGQLMVPSDAVFDGVNNRLLVVNGFGNVTIYGIDSGKNPVYIDVTPPTFTVNQVPAEVAVNVVTLSGTVEAGATVQVASGSSVLAGVVQAKNWSAVVSGLALGNNSIIVTAKDGAGNVAPSQAVNVNYLLPAPLVAISPLSSITKNSVVTVSGTVDAGSTVVVANQLTSVSGSAVVTGGMWSCEATLTEGFNNLVVTAQKAQSAKSVASAAVTLDTAKPALMVSTLANGSYTSTQVLNVSGKVSDSNAVTVTVNGASAMLTDNVFSVPITLNSGANDIRVVAADAAGNTSVDARTVNFDASMPIISIVDPVDNSFTASAVLKLNGTVDKVSAVKVAGIAAILQGLSWSATVDLVAGINTIEVVATDLYGNSSSVKRTITLDVTKPELAITFPSQDIAVNVPNIKISGTVSDASEYSLAYTLNGVAASAPVNNGLYSFNVDFSVEGNYTIALTAKDAAGNTSTVVRNFIYDVTPPTFTLDKVTGVMPTRLSGTVESGASVVVKEGAVPVGSVLISNGSWTADLSGVTYSPENLLAVATDAAGNSSSKALVYNYPDGTLNTDAKPTVQDALRAIRIVVNQLTPTAQELAHYDIGPLVNGKPNPNGKIEIVDAILILRKALGLKSW